MGAEEEARRVMDAAFVVAERAVRVFLARMSGGLIVYGRP